MNNQEIIESVWATTGDLLTYNIYDQSQRIVDFLMKISLVRQTKDNVSVIFIGLENLKEVLFKYTYKNHKQKLEETKIIERIRKKVEELKLDSIVYRKDEEIKYIDVKGQKPEKEKIKKFFLMKRNSITLLSKLIKKKQLHKEQHEMRQSKNIFHSIQNKSPNLKEDFKYSKSKSKEKYLETSTSKSKSKDKNNNKHDKFYQIPKLDEQRKYLNTSKSFERSVSPRSPRTNLKTAESKNNLKKNINPF